MKVIITFSINSKLKERVESLSFQIQAIETVTEYQIATSDDTAEYHSVEDQNVKEEFPDSYAAETEEISDENLQNIKEIYDNDENFNYYDMNDEDNDDDEDFDKINGAKKINVKEEFSSEEEDNEEEHETVAEFDYEIKYNCSLCEKSVSSENKISEHLRNVHSSECVYCDECRKPFMDEDHMEMHKLLYHDRHQKKPFKCKICDKSFKSKKTLKNHFMTIHYKFKSLHCSYCNFVSYGTLSSLRIHINQFHKEKIKTVKKPSIKNNSDEIYGELVNQYCCFGCDERNDSMTEIIKHMSECPEAKYTRCNNCDEVFRNKKHLAMHCMIYHSEKDSSIEGYKCNSCDKVSKNINQFKSHFLGMHHKFQSAICQWCQKPIYALGSFSQHMYRVHPEIYQQQMKVKMEEEEKKKEEHLSQLQSKVKNEETLFKKFKFQCFYCQFWSESELVAIDHVKEKHPDNYAICLQCNGIFQSQNYVSTHERIEHETSKDLPLQCFVCGKEFKHKRQLVDHFYFHYKFKTVFCPLCTFSTCKVEDVKMHMNRVHSGWDKNTNQFKCQFKCFICMKIYGNEEECIRHLKQDHVNEIVECPTCGKPFKDYLHIQTHHTIEHLQDKIVDNFTCLVCMQSFQNVEDIKSHFYSEHHKIQSFHCDSCLFFSDSEEKVKDHISLNHSKTAWCEICNCNTMHKNTSFYEWHVHNEYHLKYENLKCHFCDYWAQTRLRQLRDHTKTEHGKSLCTNCFNFVETKLLKEHFKGCEKIRFPCVECKQSFLSKEDKDYHVSNVHRDSYMYKCDVCSMSFPSPHHLTKHEKSVHSSEEGQCVYCGKVFANNDLDLHLEVQHGKSRTVKCKFCGEEFSGFSKNKEYEEHLATYHVSIPNTKFQCENCGQQFINKTKLTAHLKSVHKIDNSAQTSFECPQCHKILTNKYSLKLHVKSVHLNIKEHQCELCDKKCSRLSELKRHVNKVHRKLRPYKCPHCEKSFGDDNVLKQHVKWIHLKIREQCNICGVSVVDLKGHIRGVHEKKIPPRKKKIKQDFENQPFYM